MTHNSATDSPCSPPALTSPPRSRPAPPPPTPTPPPPLSSIPHAAPDGETTRVEIAFEKLYEELLRSQTHADLIYQVAGNLLRTPRWRQALKAYIAAAKRTRRSRSSGERKNRMIELMNCILEEAPACGLNVPYANDIRYGRHDVEGVVAATSTQPQDPNWLVIPDVRTPTPPGEPYRGSKRFDSLRQN